MIPKIMLGLINNQGTEGISGNGLANKIGEPTSTVVRNIKVFNEKFDCITEDKTKRHKTTLLFFDVNKFMTALIKIYCDRERGIKTYVDEYSKHFIKVINTYDTWIYEPSTKVTLLQTLFVFYVSWFAKTKDGFSTLLITYILNEVDDRNITLPLGFVLTDLINDED